MSSNEFESYSSVKFMQQVSGSPTQRLIPASEPPRPIQQQGSQQVIWPTDQSRATYPASYSQYPFSSPYSPAPAYGTSHPSTSYGAPPQANGSYGAPIPQATHSYGAYQGYAVPSSIPPGNVNYAPAQSNTSIRASPPSQANVPYATPSAQTQGGMGAQTPYGPIYHPTAASTTPTYIRVVSQSEARSVASSHRSEKSVWETLPFVPKLRPNETVSEFERANAAFARKCTESVNRPRATTEIEDGMRTMLRGKNIFVAPYTHGLFRGKNIFEGL